MKRMGTLTITSKGQVTLRKDLLTHLGVSPGEKIAVDKLPDGRIEMKAVRPPGKISEVFNLLKKKNGRSLSVEEIGEIAKQGWIGKR
jgi:bifunctional DNA-binding transcriptional regulator/antitoxin component of YhaV-PrlF toxin-antitoxin module